MFTDSTETISSQHKMEKKAKDILWALENYPSYSPITLLLRQVAETEKNHYTLVTVNEVFFLLSPLPHTQTAII